jgi:hypothetical protein
LILDIPPLLQASYLKLSSLLPSSKLCENVSKSSILLGDGPIDNITKSSRIASTSEVPGTLACSSQSEGPILCKYVLVGFEDDVSEVSIDAWTIDDVGEILRHSCNRRNIGYRANL